MCEKEGKMVVRNRNRDGVWREYKHIHAAMRGVLEGPNIAERKDYGLRDALKTRDVIVLYACIPLF